MLETAHNMSTTSKSVAGLITRYVCRRSVVFTNPDIFDVIIRSLIGEQTSKQVSVDGGEHAFPLFKSNQPDISGGFNWFSLVPPNNIAWFIKCHKAVKHCCNWILLFSLSIQPTRMIYRHVMARHFASHDVMHKAVEIKIIIASSWGSLTICKWVDRPR